MPALFTEIGYFVLDYIGVSVEVAEAVVAVLEVVAVAEILNAAQSALTPSGKTGVGANLEANYYSSEASIRIIHGEVRVGGMQTIPPVTYGANGEYLAGVLTLAGHECADITDVNFDGNIIPDSFIGSVTGTATDGAVTAGNQYSGFAWIRRYLGTQTQNADYILTHVAAPAALTSSFRGRGIAYAATQLKFDQTVYPSVPTQTYLVQGKKFYDPRLDSTQAGGSGSQRLLTPSTWTFSQNPALGLADYLMASYGGEYDPDEIDWSTVIIAANACDFALSGSLLPPGISTSCPRYASNGAYLATQGGGGQSFVDNVKMLVGAMLGRVIYANGIWSMFAGGWQTPNSVPINQNDWVSGLQIGFEQGREKRFNQAHCWFIDPDQNWQRVECYPRTNSSYVSADGDEVIPFETDQPLCTSETEAQRKAEFILRQSRNQITISGKLPPRFQSMKLWDTIYVNYDAFGWSAKSFRVSGCTINVDGSVDVSLSEEQSTDWSDLATSEYNSPSTASIPGTIGTIPSAPQNFTTKVINGSIIYDWDEGVIVPKGTRYQLLTSDSSYVAPSSREVIWFGDVSNATLQTDNNDPFYVWVRAYAGNDYSPFVPNTYGIKVSPAYVASTSPTSSWNAYFSGATQSTGVGTNKSLTISAVVVSPTAPVYSWTLVSSPSGSQTLASALSASKMTVTTSLGPDSTNTGVLSCAIRDTPNSTVLHTNVNFARINIG